MIPLHVLKETPFYQEGLEEGLEEGERRMLLELFHDFAAKRFSGLDLTAELERAQDLDGLKNLCLNLDQIPDADASRARVAALIAT
jgi:predicted transposase YdaD